VGLFPPRHFLNLGILSPLSMIIIEKNLDEFFYKKSNALFAFKNFKKEFEKQTQKTIKISWIK
jgi:hypothetical protein